MKKMFRLFTVLLSVMLITAGTVNAGLYDDVFDNLSFSEYAYYESGTLDAVQMRAFAVDPNGKYYYGGLLNSGTPTVYQFDAATTKEVCTYTFDEDPGAYIKAIAADDRGYVYMGIASESNEDAVFFSICDENGLNEISWRMIEIEGKVGVNGACVRREGDKYYLYFVTNYDTDRLYCYDVTDVNNPTLNTAFGNDGFTTGTGYLDLTSAFGMEDGNNIAVGPDGMLYMAANTGAGSKGDTVFKISSSGTGIMETASVEECFGVCTVGAYLVVCTYNGEDSQVHILNQSDLSTVKVVGYDNANNFCQLGMIGNKLYMVDQGPDAILVSTEIIFPEPEPEEIPDETTETPNEAEDTADAETPETADTGLLLASVLLLAATAVVLKTQKS